jgi:hypothetical protein
MASTWSCPQCQRRVPASLPVCRCGASREEAQAIERLRAPAGPRPIGATTRFRDEPLPLSVKALLAFMALTVVAGIASLFLPYDTPRAPALLGHFEAPRPSPSPSPGRPLGRIKPN